MITAIQYFDNQNVLKKEHLFSWTENNWLESCELRDGNNNLLHKKAFVFDSFGNPIKETLTGDLTGNGAQESYSIRREFSQEGLHLLLKEEHDNGKEIAYSYLAETNLPLTKFTKEKNKIILRTFSFYDEFNNLTKTIQDDGSTSDSNDLTGVTERTIKNYVLRTQAPFLHMPEWIEEKYWDKGEEKLLEKRHLTYDTYGNIAEEAFYDTNGEFAYTLYKEYNERGDLLSETNALGQKATYQYDSHGRRIFESNFSNRLQTTKSYDATGRLKKEKETSDNISHETAFQYNFHDLMTEKIDHFNQSTHYSYDAIAKKAVKTVSPSIATVDQNTVSVVTNNIYDPFGRIISKTDANGNTTAYEYNSHGEITKALYPDESYETYLYAKDGSLLSHKDRSGLTIQYTRDALKRALFKTYLTPNGELLGEERFTYSGFNLTSKTDLEGNLTTYTYDGAGRKVKEDYAGHITTYAYDSHGMLSNERKQNGSNPLSIHYKRDLLGRILSRIETDASGNILYEISYTYDEDGNKASITRNINGNQSTETFAYDAFRRLILHIDSLNNATTQSFDENFTNEIGQTVLQKTSTELDVQGNVRQLIDIVSKDVSNQYEYTSFGESIQKIERHFNPWLYAGKRLDPDLQLINFGKRYYNPELAKWLSEDPEGFVDSSNLYQYVYNNPFKYKDPDGRFVVAIPLFIWGSTWALPTLSAVVTPIIYGTCAAAVTVGGYYACNKIIDVYAPDRDLPKAPGGEPISDEDAEGEHTQLGTHTSKRGKGKYPQAREFDKNGKPVRDIDFTDHGRPQNHTCPHQHEWIENPTGGSKKRGDAEPL